MKRAILASAVALTFCGTAYAAELDVEGTWQTDAGALIEIADCGDGTPCGTLIKLDDGIPEDSIDANNPDHSLQDRLVLGITMIFDFERDGARWSKGKVYDPGAGRTYRASLELIESDLLELEGCVGPFCRSQKWTRIDLED